MLSTLKEIILSNLTRLSALWRYGLLDLENTRKGTTFGWLWLFIQPLIYVFVFGLAFELGIRAFRDLGSTKPYLLWVAGGVYPWFFIKNIFSKSGNAFKSLKKIVKLNGFPLATIPSLCAMPKLIIFLITYAAMLVIAIPFGAYPSIFWIQLPLIIILTVMFYYCFSLFVSCFSALSQDFANLIRALSMPFFWLSGILIPIQNVHSQVLKIFLALNPIAFLIASYRDAVFFDRWAFGDPLTLLPFIGVLILTAVMAWYNYHRLKSEVLDAI
jgi:teichoic acid transport system permease protein